MITKSVFNNIKKFLQQLHNFKINEDHENKCLEKLIEIFNQINNQTS